MRLVIKEVAMSYARDARKHLRVKVLYHGVDVVERLQKHCGVFYDSKYVGTKLCRHWRAGFNKETRRRLTCLRCGKVLV